MEKSALITLETAVIMKLRSPITIILYCLSDCLVWVFYTTVYLLGSRRTCPLILQISGVHMGKKSEWSWSFRCMNRCSGYCWWFRLGLKESALLSIWEIMQGWSGFIMRASAAAAVRWENTNLMDRWVVLEKTRNQCVIHSPLSEIKPLSDKNPPTNEMNRTVQ